MNKALADKGLKIADGARRLELLAQSGGVVQLQHMLTGKLWHLSVEGEQVNIVEAIAKPETEKFPVLAVLSLPKPSRVQISELKRTPINSRSARTQNESPSP